jgi:hypothetical protein
MFDYFKTIPDALETEIWIVLLSLLSLVVLGLLFIVGYVAIKKRVKIRKGDKEIDIGAETHTDVVSDSGEVVGSVDTSSTNKTNSVNIELNKEIKP